MIGYIKRGDLVKVVLLLQRMDLEELETIGEPLRAGFSSDCRGYGS
jgi:hypothetical protein